MATGKGLNQPARRAIETRKREAQILELRYQGVSLIEIAERYGISATRVSKIYYRALARIAEPIAELERRRALEVADRALAKLWSMVDPLTPGVDPIMPELDAEARIKVYLTILRWEEYRARLLGLFELELPDQMQTQRSGGLTNEPVEAIKRKLMGIPPDVLPGETAEAYRARLTQWRAAKEWGLPPNMTLCPANRPHATVA
jgi:DNA-binding CsgD family transcriptional regulator